MSKTFAVRAGANAPTFIAGPNGPNQAARFVRTSNHGLIVGHEDLGNVSLFNGDPAVSRRTIQFTFVARMQRPWAATSTWFHWAPGRWTGTAWEFPHGTAQRIRAMFLSSSSFRWFNDIPGNASLNLITKDGDEVADKYFDGDWHEYTFRLNRTTFGAGGSVPREIADACPLFYKDGVLMDLADTNGWHAGTSNNPVWDFTPPSGDPLVGVMSVGCTHVDTLTPGTLDIDSIRVDIGPVV
ncbi:MAG: hypothetical protein EA406_13615 [Rhodospirillales bacterium]|nr:MAG: hypothetical protein EA406_13615 [Rhodospirillales bacterium]